MTQIVILVEMRFNVTGQLESHATYLAPVYLLRHYIGEIHKFEFQFNVNTSLL